MRFERVHALDPGKRPSVAAQIARSPISEFPRALRGPGTRPRLTQRIENTRRAGNGLTQSLRAPMERDFGHDFSAVRVHTDGESDSLSRALGARAFTVGHDIFFRHGHYNAASEVGQQLLAHELTHVVQQRGGAPQAKLAISQPGDPWSDQWSSKGGWKEYDRSGLDSEITRLTQAWWKEKPENLKPNTKTTLWRLRSAPAPTKAP